MIERPWLNKFVALLKRFLCWTGQHGNICWRDLSWYEDGRSGEEWYCEDCRKIVRRSKESKGGT